MGGGCWTGKGHLYIAINGTVTIKFSQESISCEFLNTERSLTDLPGILSEEIVLYSTSRKYLGVIPFSDKEILSYFRHFAT